MRQLKLRMPDETVKSVPVDEYQPVANLMVIVCTKLGITNHDEYSLIATGSHNTIDGRRKDPAKVEGQIIDAKMEQLKKKLKTDEDLAWLDHSKTLDEQGVRPDDVVLLRRKFFYSDHNVDSRDPIQLSLLYVQTRDAILAGTHPVTVDGACKFAGLQAQAQMGNFVEGKTTRPGFMNLKSFLPADYTKIKHVERKIFSEHRKHFGMSELDAKARYVGEARSLSTYGVTFFLVKEKVAGKNKLVPRLLGVTRDSVIRVDSDSKAVLKTWPLTTVKRWAASVNSFTLDFGDYADAYYSVQTTEGEQISQLIAGYIDIILKRKKAKDHFGIEGDEGATMIEDSVAPSRATVLTNVATLPRQPKPEPPKSEIEREEIIVSKVGPEVQRMKLVRAPIVEPGEFRGAVEVRGRAEVGFESRPLTQYVTNYELTIPQKDLQNKLEHAQDAVEAAQKELDKSSHQQHYSHYSSRTTQDDLAVRKRKLSNDFANINAATAQIVSLSAIPEDELDYPELNAAVETVASSLPGVARDVKLVAASMEDKGSSEQLIEAARHLCKAFNDLLNAAQPGPTVPRQTLISAASRVGDATQALLYSIDGANWTASQADLSAESNDTLLALAKSVANTAAALVLHTKDVATVCSKSASEELINGATQCALATSQMVATAKIVASTINDKLCRAKLLDSCHEVRRSVDGIQKTCMRELHDPQLLTGANDCINRVNCALDELIAYVNNIARSNQQAGNQDSSPTTTITTNTRMYTSNQQTEKQPRHSSIYESQSDNLNTAPTDNSANRELLKQARTLAQATTQLIQDIRPTNQVTQPHQQQHQAYHQHQQQPSPQPQQTINRHSVYETENYEDFRKQQQLANEAVATRNLWQQEQQQQQHDNNIKSTTTTTTTTTTILKKQKNEMNNKNESEYLPQVSNEPQIRIQQIEASDPHDDYQGNETQINIDNVDDVDDDAELAISGIIGDLETTIVYASAGTLHANQDDSTYSHQRENILHTAKALVDGTKQLVTSAAGDERQLAAAARESVVTISKLVDAVKAGSASLSPSNVDARLSLIRSVKDVAGSLSELIGSTKAAHRQDASDSSMSQVKDSAKSMVTSVTSLLRTVKSVEDEQERGVRAIELAIEAIENELNVHETACEHAEQQSAGERQEARARPEELVRVSKPMTLAAAKTVSAASSGRQDDAIVAANMGRKALSDLLLVSRCASFGADEQELRARVQDAGRQCALGYRQLLELVHQTLQRPSNAATNPEIKQLLVGQSRQLAACVTEVVKCSELLRTAQASLGEDRPSNNGQSINEDVDDQQYTYPDGGRPMQSRLVSSEDPSAIAETELLGAASSIDAAARKLENLKPRITSVKLPHEELNFDEIILEAAKSIIEATAALLRAASASQRDLLVDGRLDETETFYAPDNNQWSEGLVSAARMVAAATHSLVEAANSLVQGAASEERLISAAKQVASSTNQLIVACKVKADPDSKTISRLQKAGNAVKRSTDNLVRASQQAIEHDEEQSLVISNRKVSGIAQEISAREQILRKEKELQVAKTQLMAIRKAKYSNKPDDDDYQGYGGALD